LLQQLNAMIAAFKERHRKTQSSALANAGKASEFDDQGLQRARNEFHLFDLS
jgi:hypothetical protein